MLTLLASLIASIAIGAQDVTPPDRFVRIIERGEAVISDSFIGIEGHARDGETLFAGLDLDTFVFVTGP